MMCPPDRMAAITSRGSVPSKETVGKPERLSGLSAVTELPAPGGADGLGATGDGTGGGVPCANALFRHTHPVLAPLPLAPSPLATWLCLVGRTVTRDSLKSL